MAGHPKSQRALPQTRLEVSTLLPEKKLINREFETIIKIIKFNSSHPKISLRSSINGQVFFLSNPFSPFACLGTRHSGLHCSSKLSISSQSAFSFGWSERLWFFGLFFRGRWLFLERNPLKKLDFWLPNSPDFSISGCSGISTATLRLLSCPGNGSPFQNPIFLGVTYTKDWIFFFFF